MNKMGRVRFLNPLFFTVSICYLLITVHAFVMYLYFFFVHLFSDIFHFSATYVSKYL